ncbi:TIR domain-containing adapter molecule 1 [Chiloscyllium plagiosum]|uniref:TIR domain-containing adapter molecule 1 n=1 Tax=Chiloscyllium plagiosum TaxID=36176 RepID=UPI001CB87DF9|nr:TIR domain-containing adapter molecule 1 [Chiloscyllium plagiosum]
MAEDCDHIPSLDDLFNILSEVTEQRLFSLWYKFYSNNSRTSKVHQLLYSIISFFLKKTDEAERAAMLVLNEMPNDRSALYILNKIRGLEGGAQREQKTSEISNEEFSAEDGNVLRDLALMLALLVEENLCNSSMRNQACQAAIKAFKSNNQNHKMDLQELIEEFRWQFGPMSFEGEENAEVSALKSTEEQIPSMRSTIECRTNPVTVPSKPATDSLNNSEITIPTHFEISASPTASFISNSHRDNLNSPIANSEESTVNLSHSMKRQLNLSSDKSLGEVKVTNGIRVKCVKQKNVPSACLIEGSSQTQVNEVRPTECTGERNSSQLVSSKSKMSEDWETGNEEHTNSISHDPSLGATKLPTGDQSNSTETTSGKFSPSTPPPPADEEIFENKFYSFVVLHAREDAEIAENVQLRLESLVKMEGATFSEEFCLPGRSPIKCIEDAINNSAFTILLLTHKFNSRWEEYKTNSVLMHSIRNEHKYNTVIPLLPKKSRMCKNDIPFALTAINSLDENSRHFERHVKKTFTWNVLERHKKSWLQEQERKQIEEKTAQAQKDYQSALKTLSANWNYVQICSQLAQSYHHFQATHPPHPGPAAVNGHAQPVLHPPPYPNLPVFPGFNIPLSSLPNQPNFNPQHAMYQIMQPPFQFINPSNNQNVNVSSSTQQQGQGTNIIQIQHAKNVQIGDSNQMTITDLTESCESTDDEDRESEHN